MTYFVFYIWQESCTHEISTGLSKQCQLYKEEDVMTLRLSREWGNTEWVGGGKQCGYDLNTLYRIHIYIIIKI